jgi:hypothetical protein
MSTSDYPLLTVPGYELYQVAHLTAVAVDVLARRRRTAEQSDRLALRVAAAAQLPRDAADQRSAQVSASASGFPAAASALPGPGTTPSGFTRSPSDGAAARSAPSSAARQASSVWSTPAP